MKQVDLLCAAGSEYSHGDWDHQEREAWSLENDEQESDYRCTSIEL